MLFQKPQPTPAQLREARNMLADLERLLEAGKENAYALVIREVLSGGDVELQRWLTSGDFWGGMGSMIDSAFCTPTSLGREMDHRNKREFMRLIARLGRHQLTSGIHTWGIKPGIRKWTELFESWLK